MDPLTAFSLACGVIQVVDFSTKALMMCKEIYDHGSLSEYQDLEGLAKHLTHLRQVLSFPSHTQSLSSIKTLDDKSLLSVAEECSKTAQKLVVKLEALKIEGAHKRRQSIKKTWKALREKGEIQEIQKCLDGYRNALDTQILVDLRWVRDLHYGASGVVCAFAHDKEQRHNLAQLQQSRGFHDLDMKVQIIIASLSLGPKKFEELSALTQNENEKTREYVNIAFQQHQRQFEKREYRKRLLGSLWFDEIYSREEQIVDAYRGTFEWILDKSDQPIGLKDNFVEWLESGQGTYWVNGKAGSGKSTLMSFLCQDERTRFLLEIWSGDRCVLMPKFFFWTGGTLMQKCVEGLLRSLIWQVLKDLPDMDIEPTHIENRSAFENGTVSSRDAIAAWTERRLRATLRDLLQRASASYHLCLFIDGLDEFNGDQDELVSLIQNIANIPGVKVCLSSRPYQAFDQAFGSSPHLRLQDLTHSDIQKFVVNKFQSMPRVVSISTDYPHWLDNITTTILSRAEGVFLWVNLAVKDQIRGLRNGDTPQQLEERLNDLPNEVEGIYARMLSQIEKPYRKEAAVLLLIGLHGYMYHILDSVLASRDDLDDIVASSHKIPELELLRTSHSLRRRIADVCAGLLEVHVEHNVSSPPEDSCLSSENPTFYPPAEGTIDEIHDLALRISLHFVHRTAHDFMKNREQGEAFIETNKPPGFNSQVSYVKVLIARMRLFGYNDKQNRAISNFMIDTWEAENQTGVAQTELCHLINLNMSRIDQNHPDWRPDSHWCTRWGGDIWNSWNTLAEPSYTESVTDLRALTSSSSSDSFYSTSSRPEFRAGTTETLDPEIYFLSFAAYYSLSRYVRQSLNSRKTSLTTDEASILLYCSVWSIGQGISATAKYLTSLDLIDEFLTQGGNPNFTTSYSSIWSEFLYQLDCLSHINHYTDRQVDSAQWIDLRSRFMKTTVSFLGKGADVHADCFLRVHCEKSWRTALRESSKAGARDVDEPIELEPFSVSYEMHIPAFAAIDYCLSDHCEISRIREICAAKGAQYHSQHGKVSAILRDDQELDFSDKSRLYEEFDLSEQDSITFLEIFEKDYPAALRQDQFRHQVWKFSSELYRNRLKSTSHVDEEA